MVKHHRKPALRPAGRACQGRRAHTTVRQLFLCGFPSSLRPGGPAGVGVAVLKSMQGGRCHRLDLAPTAAGRSRRWDHGFFPSAVLIYGQWQRGFPRPAGWCGMPALAGHKVVRLKGSAAAAAAGWGVMVWLSILHLVQLQGPGGSHPSPARDAGTALTGCLPSCIAFQVLVLSSGFPLPSLGTSGVWTRLTTSFLRLWGGWPFICRVEQCPACSGPLVLLTFKYVSNKASEWWALAS